MCDDSTPLQQPWIAHVLVLASVRWYPSFSTRNCGVLHICLVSNFASPRLIFGFGGVEDVDSSCVSRWPCFAALETAHHTMSRLNFKERPTSPRGVVWFLAGQALQTTQIRGEGGGRSPKRAWALGQGTLWRRRSKAQKRLIFDVFVSQIRQAPTPGGGGPVVPLHRHSSHSETPSVGVGTFSLAPRVLPGDCSVRTASFCPEDFQGCTEQHEPFFVLHISPFCKTVAIVLFCPDNLHSFFVCYRFDIHRPRYIIYEWSMEHNLEHCRLCSPKLEAQSATKWNLCVSREMKLFCKCEFYSFGWNRKYNLHSLCLHDWSFFHWFWWCLEKFPHVRLYIFFVGRNYN